MKEAGLQVKIKRKFRVNTTDSNYKLPVAENVLDRILKFLLSAFQKESFQDMVGVRFVEFSGDYEAINKTARRGSSLTI